MAAYMLSQKTKKYTTLVLYQNLVFAFFSHPTGFGYKVLACIGLSKGRAAAPKAPPTLSKNKVMRHFGITSDLKRMVMAFPELVSGGRK